MRSRRGSTYKTNGTVAAVHSIQVVVEADDAYLAEDGESPKKAPLPEDIGAPINDALSYSAKTFTQDNAEYDLPTQVEDETQLNSGIA
jgi:hypothetical protein